MLQTDASDSAPHPRPLWAALLGLFVPGLGYLYAGSAALAVTAAVTTPLTPILLLYAGIHRTRAGALALAVVVAALLIVPAVHVARRCRWAPRVQRSRARSVVRYGLFLVLLLAWQGVVSSLARATAARMCVRVLRITGESMAPTLMEGDWIVVNTCRSGRVRVGGLAFFARPDRRGVLMIKRVVGTVGDTVEITPTATLVNNRLHSSHRAPVADNQVYGPVTVQPGTLFLVGDNLPASVDSRHFGVVPQSLVRGPVPYVLWSPRGGIARSLASLVPSP